MAEDILKNKEPLLPNSSEPIQEETNSNVDKRDSTTSSVRAKKHSNIFSAIVKKARRKKITNASKELKESSLNLSCASTISMGVHVEEIELSCQSYDKKMKKWDSVCSETNTSNHTLDHPDTPNSKPLEAHFSLPDNQMHEHEEMMSSFIPFNKPILNLSLVEGLQYILELSNQLQTSENHIINLLTRYIQDNNVQKDLLEALSYHAKLQLEAERRATTLASDMWMQQLEAGRAQEKTFQDTLTSLVKQNRQLQGENEHLFKKYEKVLVKLRTSPESKSKYHGVDTLYDDQIESMFRHNEKLQVKLETTFRKIEGLEGELCLFKKQNESMEQQLRNSTISLQRQRAEIQTIKIDHNLEKVVLNQKIDVQEKTMQETIELGNIILEDINHIKGNANILNNLYGSKTKINENCINDILHLCRNIINGLSNELINTQNLVAIKDRDIENLQERNSKLQEHLNNSATELTVLSKQIEEQSIQRKEKIIYEQKHKLLEDELRDIKTKWDDERKQWNEEKMDLSQEINKLKLFKNEVQEKEKILNQTKLFIANITTENCALKDEIICLNRSLMENGAGDYIAQIESSKVKIDILKQEVFQLRKDKSVLAAQLEKVQSENTVQKSSRDLSYKHLERQLKDKETIQEENKILRQKYETEHLTVQSLQNERMKYLEEKTMLKTVIQQLKAQIAKVPLLEEDLNNVTREASKLGLIAEYNKQQMEKTKHEVIERDRIINQLKNNVQKLNEIQMQNAKEKLSLCHELHEMCQVKEKLSDVLNCEVKKSAQLGQSKEAVEKTIQIIEEKHKNERSAIRILLRDMRMLNDEKQKIIKDNENLSSQVNMLTTKLSNEENKVNEYSKDILKKEQEINTLRKEETNLAKLKNDIIEKYRVECAKYDNNVRQLKTLIEQLRKENKELDASVGYLKKNAEKLQKDLDSSRKNEKEFNDKVNELSREKKSHEMQIADHLNMMKTIQRENGILKEQNSAILNERDRQINEIICLSGLLDKVVNDFENSIKASEEKEELFKAEIIESQKLIKLYLMQIEDNKKVLEKHKHQLDELVELKEKETHFETKCSKLKQELKDLEKEYLSIKEKNEDLEANCKEIANELDLLKAQMQIIVDQKEKDYVYYKKHLAELTRKHENEEKQNKTETGKLKQQLNEIKQKMDNEKTAYETLAQVHKDVSNKFMRSIKDLMDVKNKNREISEELKEKCDALKKIEDEKTDLKYQLNCTKTEIECLKRNVIDLKEKNHLLEESEPFTTNQEITNLRNEIEETQSNQHELKKEIIHYKQDIALLQLQKSEIALELHETEKKFETEKQICEQLSNTHKLLLAAVLNMKDSGKVESSDCLHLLHMISATNLGKQSPIE
ncbi:uncharacterized protein LOC143199161 [Rhynchophorus ferrugineus]|uniref:uncharacterized protein LOC143199161 n=1 Tax=Rhynchophorus ferrugineus TaxID=354439 RepID=UPI003FCD8CFD